VFRAEARAGVHEKDVVGQVPQARTQEESLHQEQPRVLIVVVVVVGRPAGGAAAKTIRNK